MLLTSRKVLFAGVGYALLSLAACQDTDPLTRDRGDWKPAGVNQDNLAAQVANPADLTAGVADDGGDANQAVMAVDRLKSDKVKAIEHVGLVSIGGGGSQ